MFYIEYSDRSKLGVEEVAELISSDGPLEGVNDKNLEVAVYGTEYFIIQGTDGKVLGITHGTASIIKPDLFLLRNSII